jgi:hypothetical protein
MEEYKYFNKVFNIINKHTINTQSIYFIYNNIIINSYLSSIDSHLDSISPVNNNFIYINKKTSYYYDAKKDGIFLNDDKIFLSIECRIQTKKDTLNNIVKSGLHIYNMSICCMLMRNKIFNKIL